MISLLVSDFKDQCGSVPSISVAVLGLINPIPIGCCHVIYKCSVAVEIWSKVYETELYTAELNLGLKKSIQKCERLDYMSG